MMEGTLLFVLLCKKYITQTTFGRWFHNYKKNDFIHVPEPKTGTVDGKGATDISVYLPVTSSMG